MKNKFKKGFTLVELLIVITIIGILAAALLPSILGAPAKSRDAAREAGMQSVVSAIETYASSGLGYTSNVTLGKAECLTALTAPAPADLAKYFPNGALPKDPSGTDIPNIAGIDCKSYVYLRLNGSPSNYALITSMEDKKKNNVNYGFIKSGMTSSDLLNAQITAATLPAGCKTAGTCDAYVKAF